MSNLYSPPATPVHALYRWGRRLKYSTLRKFATTHAERVERNAALNCLELWQGRTTLCSTPLIIQVGTNQFCNLRCNFCRLNQPEIQASFQKLSRTEKEISPVVIERLLAIMPYAERVTLTPLGEPLLWSGMGDLLAKTRRLGVDNLEMTSNGMLLEKFAGNLNRDVMRHITLSVDSNNPQTYAGMRVGGDLRQVERGIRAVVAKPDEQRPKLTVAASFLRRNIEQLPSMVQWAADLGIDTLAVQLMDIENPALESEHLSHFPELTGQMLQEAIQCGERLNFPVVTAVGMEKFLKLNKLTPNTQAQSLESRVPLVEQCSDPWNGLLIDTDGDCRPCCWAGISYGNINHSSFEQVWNGSAAQETRRLFLANELPVGCQGRHCRVRI